MPRVFFYLQYAARNLRRNLRWTLFAVFCIAAGVAAIVALRGLGLAIADSLVENARSSNRGDITVSTFSAAGNFGAFASAGREDDSLPASAVTYILQRAADLGGRATSYTLAGNMQITAVDAARVGRPQFISALMIDPATFPVTDPILAQEPAGVPISRLLNGSSVVISRNLADEQGLNVGDSVRVSGTTELFTVTGIVATEQEASLRNLFASFFGFAYFDRALSDKLQIHPEPNTISLSLPPGADIEAVGLDVARVVPQADITTFNQVLRQNQQIADVIGRFIVVMGLGALLIGGVGIINTMLVMVGRRTMEIASFKTFGLKGGQISALFLSEAFLLGLMGSAVGCVLGVLLSGAVNAFGEAFLQQRLAWRIYPEALWYGLGLGMVVTMVFGLLPVLTANRVRPATILRPNEMVIPGASVFHSLLVLALVVIVIGGIAGRIVGNIWIGMIGVAVTLAIMGLLVGQLWVTVWLVGKLPSLGNVDFKLALRNLTARRLRTATTLLALSGGMFALSSITFFGFGAREILNFQLVNQLGGNVLIFPLASLFSGDMGEEMVDTQLQNVQGVTYRTEISNYTGDIQMVNGQPAQLEIPFLDMATFGDDDGELPASAQRQIDRIRESNVFITLQMRVSDNPSLTSGAIIAGRDFRPEDRGEPRLVASDGLITQGLGLQPGDVLTLNIGRRGQPRDYTLVGITSSPSIIGGTGSFFLAPEAISSAESSFTFYTIQVEEERLNDALLALSTNPLNFAVDVRFIDGLVARFIAQFSAIPTVVGLLSLLAAAVTMANTVSLATLERRRQIGILKTVGLKSARVLWVMLLENTLIGLLGGLLGIGLSVLGVSLMTQLAAGELIPFPREAVPIAIFLLLASILIAWLATFLSAAPVTQERVTSVLRYE